MKNISDFFRNSSIEKKIPNTSSWFLHVHLLYLENHPILMQSALATRILELIESQLTQY